MCRQNNDKLHSVFEVEAMAKLLTVISVSQKIVIQNVSLQQLWELYHPHHNGRSETDAALITDELSFTRYAPDSNKPLEIRGRDDSSYLPFACK